MTDAAQQPTGTRSFVLNIRRARAPSLCTFGPGKRWPPWKARPRPHHRAELSRPQTTTPVPRHREWRAALADVGHRTRRIAPPRYPVCRPKRRLPSTCRAPGDSRTRRSRSDVAAAFARLRCATTDSVVELRIGGRVSFTCRLEALISEAFRQPDTSADTSAAGIPSLDLTVRRILADRDPGGGIPSQYVRTAVTMCWWSTAPAGSSM